MKKIYAVLVAICYILLYNTHANAQTCNGTWGTPIVNQTFGEGTASTGMYGPLSTYAPGATTSTIFVTSPPLPDGEACLTPNCDDVSQGWITMTDHTGDPNGLMFLINAPSTDATVFFEYSMSDLCPNTVLQLSIWIINANPTSTSTASNYQYPNMQLNLIDLATNNVIATSSTGDVAADEVWHNYTLVFNNVNSTNVKLQLVNHSVGSGFGNDLAIDDITVSPCVPVSHLSPKVDTVICQDATIHFTANITGNVYNPAEYQWQYSTDMGVTWINGQPASGNANYDLPISVANPNTYWVRFLVGPTGFAGNTTCTGISDTSIITIGSKPPIPTISGTTTYCLHQPFVPLTVTGANIKWYTALTGGTGSTTAPVVNTSVPGNYTFYASQTTAQGCESDRATVTISVYSGVNADYTYTVHFGCGQDTVAFSNQSTDTATYKWDFGDGSISTEKNPVHIYTTQSVFSVRLTVFGEHCNDTGTVQIDLNHPLHASFTVDHDTVCAGQPITFTNTSVSVTMNNIAPTYAWDFNDNTTDNTNSPVHMFAVGGVYTVRMVITDFVPCSDTTTYKVYIDSTPYMQLATDTLVACQGQSFTISADYQHDANTGLYWDFGDGSNKEGASPIHHAYGDPGSYTITVRGTYSNCPDVSSTGLVNVTPYPLVNLGPDTTMCPNAGPILLIEHANIGNPAAHWLWNTGDSTATITATEPGLYFTTVSINGCSNADSIQIFKDCYIDIPNSFTPNSDGVNDYFFPRQLLSRSVTTFSMNIYNRWGQVIFETQNTSGRGWDGKFNDVPQPDGVYIYIIDVSYANGVKEHYTGNVTLLR